MPLPIVQEISADGHHRGIDYLEVLELLSRHLAPASYLEVGTRRGESLVKFGCDAVSIDPHYIVNQNVIRERKRSFFFQMTSDSFFAEHDLALFFPRGIDIAFLDGMHRFEFLLRDFINTERYCHRNSVILMHDCLPHNQSMASRAHKDGDYSAGDVWKLIPILKKFRPDIKVFMFDSPPTGLVACTNLDPESKILARRFHHIVDEFLDASDSIETLLGLRSV
jgi:hypothetical protein